jgi:predicted ATPase
VQIGMTTEAYSRGPEQAQNGGVAERFSFKKLKTKLGIAADGKLYGREKEESILQQAFQRCVKDSHQELILISGKGGTGKTALANTLRHVTAKEKGFFVSGKFEEQAVAEPYEVFITALTDYTDQVMDSLDDIRLQKLRDEVQKAVGNDGRLLTSVIPALTRLLGETGQPPKLFGTEAQIRFRFVFCNFVRALASTAPVVLFLDDLQWADTASCEMVRHLMHTTGSMPLLLIGAHRCDLETKDKEKDDPTKVICVACMQMKPFVATMKDLEREHTKNPDRTRMQSIDLANLDAAAVNKLIQDLLEKTESDTMGLAEVIIAQTEGNVFHVLQFLRLLLDQGFLTKTIEDKWKWDEEVIRSKLKSETIMDIVRQTIDKLPRLAKEALKVASCMGDEIDDSALDLVLQTSTGKDLELAAEQGLLVFFPQFGGYRFAHDWIRQTAYEMTPKNEREEFHLKIGRKLWKSSSAVAMKRNIFVVVSLLNKGIKIMKEERERYKVAELNLEAAEKAANAAAFPDASKFSRKGIQLLSRNRWNDYYELTLSLYSLSCEVEAINGNYERVVLYIEEIVEKARCLEDKLRAYAALIRSMGQQDNLQEATTVGIDVLDQLGEPLPSKPNKFAVNKELTKVKMALRGKTNQDLLNLPPMKDSIKSATLQILNLIFLSSYQARSPYTPLVAFRAVALTLKYGMHEASSVSFAIYSMMLCGLGLDFKAGQRYGELAITMAEKMQSREHTPLVHYLVAAGVNHWMGPLSDCNESLLFASRAAMEVGDAEIAVLSKITTCVDAIFAGTKMSAIEEDIEECIETAELYRKHMTAILGSATMQLLHCYSGKAKNPARLDGDAMKFQEVVKECKEAHNERWVSWIHFFATDLAYMFGDYAHAHKMAGENKDDPNAPHASFAAVENRYKQGLTAIALVRQGKDKGKNTKFASETLKKVTLWAKNAPQNYAQKQLLLEAEIKSLKGPKQKSKVYPVYEQALKSATNMGYRNESALIYERFADYKLLCGDPDASTLYSRSIEMYDEWGASAKSEQLRNKLAGLKA